MTEFDVVLEHAYKTFPGGVRAVIDFNAELAARHPASLRSSRRCRLHGRVTPQLLFQCVLAPCS